MTLCFFLAAAQAGGLALALRLSRFAREERFPRPGRSPHEFRSGLWETS